jgi:hypothetical protein
MPNESDKASVLAKSLATEALPGWEASTVTNALYRQRPDVIVRQEGASTLVFEQSAGRICVMNETSAFILAHCTEGTSIEDLADLLRKKFDFSQCSEGDTSLAELVTQHVQLLQEARILEAVDCEGA